MRKAVTIILGVVMCVGTAGAARAQMGAMGDTLKKGAADSAKQGIDNTLGTQGSADAAANPKAAAKDAAAAPAADPAGAAGGAAAPAAAPAADPAADSGDQGE